MKCHIATLSCYLVHRDLVFLFPSLVSTASLDTQMDLAYLFHAQGASRRHDLLGHRHKVRRVPYRSKVVDIQNHVNYISNQTHNNFISSKAKNNH